MQCNKLAAKVSATTTALMQIWGFDGRQHYALAHMLATYFTFKPAALLKEVIALSLTVPDQQQSLDHVLLTNLQDLLTQPLHGAAIIRALVSPSVSTNASSSTLGRIPTTLKIVLSTCLLGLGGYPDPSHTEPLVKGVKPYNIMFCVLHALTHIGDLVVNWLHNWTMNQPDHQVLLVKLNSVLFGQWVHLAISDMAPMQGWHLKVHHLFHIMYIFNPFLPSHKEDMVWFQANMRQVMETFTTIICSHHQPNYETLQCMLKAAFHNWSPHYSGTSTMDMLWMVWEQWFMRMQVCVLEGCALIPFLNTDLKRQLSIEALLSSPSTAGVV
ncbi:uncharacterized protein ACA1_058490 [Acanthamoeba castellanii str. Neff]|uniref:Uncharacterized protein n=1 Tax=Acanthamoeba castellanii (strain ATCC 30010 / Neff) TaxID=1257118 RepID=L8GX99_ACACF|nr:uncharacterized protein ACA1_058490 [Acanthamoeba castellanii str. Neff]ELR17193.1 hypothetical protein ACA1_058490 [Acanthamoeba castellanii str. Neff]